MTPDNNNPASQEEATASKKHKAKKRDKAEVAATVSTKKNKIVIKKEQGGNDKIANNQKQAKSKKEIEKKKAVALKITLQLNYHTKYGQQIFVTGNTLAFGNNDSTKALAMQYLDNDNWVINAEISIDELNKHAVHYNYFVVLEDGSVIYDWGSDKVIDKNLAAYKEVYIHDAWNYAGYFENAYFTEPFQQHLLKKAAKNKSQKTPKYYTHLFKVKAPILKSSETVCILGDAVMLGSWQKEDAVLLSKHEGEDSYSVAVDASKATFPLTYKYGIYNLTTGIVTNIEQGNNRVIFENFCENKSKLAVLNDGFINTETARWKGAGVSIPVFSLRTEKSWGVGEFTDLKLLIDWAKHTGLQLIQLLPVNDTTATRTYTDSYPYAAISAFALHPMYLNIEQVTTRVIFKKLLEEYSEEIKTLNAGETVDYEAVNNLKWKIIKTIYPSLKKKTFSSFAYKEFFENNKHWLVPYAAFCYYRDFYGSADFSIWPHNRNYLAQEADELLKPDHKDFDKAAIYCFVQFYLHLQLKEATEYAHSKGVIVKGDIAIGVYRNGVDAWQQPELYHMEMQAGAPPDDFAVTGQNWGFPTYNWVKMKDDHFLWWKQRFAQMSNYFDAFRIDHILGFFRIWSIPMHAMEGIMGHFEPCIPVHISEFGQRNIWFDYDRYCKPFITDALLNNVFGDKKNYVVQTFLENYGNGNYGMNENFKTQRQVKNYFELSEKNDYNDWLKQSLYNLISNVVLFEVEGSHGQQFHFRFATDSTYSFRQLDWYTQQQLKDVYVNYFFRRQDAFWQTEAMQKLPALKKVTNMLICGEDLGLVPACVPVVMQQLGLLSLEIQRMPKQTDREFFHPNDAPYLSVVTPATHDMSTIRGWWEEDRAATQRFYNYIMGEWGDAPYFCEAWINKKIVEQHLYSPAMWSIFQIQDLLGLDAKIRKPNPNEERINIPAISNYYWRYRMHLTLENLMKADEFNDMLLNEIKACGRAVAAD